MLKSTLLYIKQGLITHIGAFSPVIIIEDHIYRVLFTHSALLLSTTSSGSLYGKTGTGRVNGKDVNGWFIGYIETANNTYYFATNIQSSSGATGSQATEITESVLSNLGIWK